MTLSVIPATAEAALLARPLRSIADIEVIEATPLEERIGVVDFSRRVDLALAARAPDDDALLYVPDGDAEREAERVSFRTLQANIRRTASLLHANGIRRGDVVAVLLPNVPQIYWAILGALSTGIVFPPNWMMEPRGLLHLLRRADVKAIITLGPTPGFKIWETLSSIAGELPAGLRIWSVAGPDGTVLADSDLDLVIAREPDRSACPEPVSGHTIGAYVHSGGTTGAPKIVKLSHRNMSYRHWSLQLASAYQLGEVVLHDTPMFHVGGLVGRCLPPLASGASILIPSVMGARDKHYLATYWRFVEKYRVTRLSGVPTSLAVLAKSRPARIDLSSLQPNFITGSTALPAAVRDEFERISGVRVLNSYGMTENTASIAIDPRDGPRKDGSSGLRVPYTHVRVVALNEGAADVRLCGPEEIGMLQVKGPGVAHGYVDPAHAIGARTADGWLVTGDLGRVDVDGYVFVTGRTKDIIIRGGHNIDPALIEEPLLKLPEVLHAAAVGKPDAYAGELPVAYVQLAPGARSTESELIAAVAAQIAERAAIPKEIIVLEKLPLTDIGKPMKQALRHDIAERTFQSILQAATKLPASMLQLSLAVHPTKGDQLTIRVGHCRLEERRALAARIDDAMRPFACPYHIEWAAADR
jgi:fatty-acyl-CoA synthase